MANRDEGFATHVLLRYLCLISTFRLSSKTLDHLFYLNSIGSPSEDVITHRTAAVATLLVAANLVGAADFTFLSFGCCVRI